MIQNPGQQPTGGGGGGNDSEQWDKVEAINEEVRQALSKELPASLPYSCRALQFCLQPYSCQALQFCCLTAAEPCSSAVVSRLDSTARTFLFTFCSPCVTPHRSTGSYPKSRS